MSEPDITKMDAVTITNLDAAVMAPWMRGLWNASEEELKCPMTGLVDPLSGALSGAA